MNEEEKKYLSAVSESFNTTFVEEGTLEEAPDGIATEIKEVEEKTTALQKTIENSLLVIKDQNYIDFEIKSLISSTNNILEKLEGEIKIGDKNSTYLAFCTIVNTKRELLKELIIFNKLLLDMSVFAPEEDEKAKEEEKTLQVTSSDMLKFFNQMKEQSELNIIEVEASTEE